jgi:hypothetical protein
MTKAAAFFLLLTAPLLHARLGETLAECEARYGPVVERQEARLQESDKQAAIFSKEGVTIRAELQNGVVWCISYQMEELTQESAEYFLKVNAPADGWSKPIRIKGDNIYTTSTRNQFATHTPMNPRVRQAGKVVVCNRGYAKANRADYEARLLTIRDKLVEREKNAALKGF